MTCGIALVLAVTSGIEPNVVKTVGGRHEAVPATSAASTATAVAPALGKATAADAGTTLYVNDRKGSNCSDTAAGAGSQTVPFCTLQAMADAVVAGDTVLVTPGLYAPFTISAQGTASAPITVESSDGRRNGIEIVDSAAADHAISVEGASHLDLEDIWINMVASGDFVLIDNSHNVTVGNSINWVAAAFSGYVHGPSVHVTGQSTAVTLTRDSFANGGGQPYIEVDAGGSGDVIADNSLWSDGVPPLTVAGTPGVEVDAGSTSGTTLDYNLNYAVMSSSPGYLWNGVLYPTAAALQAATGQGVHELSGLPQLYLGGNAVTPHWNSPAIDSANSAAPGEQPTDIFSQPCVDDPSYPVTGAGNPAYCTRGEFQYQDPLSAMITAADQGSMSVSADATLSHGLHGVAGYSFDFGDGTTAVVNTTGTAQHTYAHSGSYTVTVTVSDSTGATNAASAGILTAGADMAPFNPTRVLDTRNGTGIGSARKIPAGSSVLFPLPAALQQHGNWLTGVALNLTVADATGNGFVGTSTWNTSSINYTAGQTVAGFTIAPVTNESGTLSVWLTNNGSGSADLIADLTGFFAKDATSGYQPAQPTRPMDTRTGLGGSLGKLTPGRPDVLTVEGATGGVVPSTGVTAVAVNLTVTDTTGPGYLTAYPDGTSAPNTSDLNFVKGQTVANFAILPLGADGRLDLSASTPLDMIVDIVGYFDSAGGSAFVTSDIYRDIDTRNGDAGWGCDPAKGALRSRTTLAANLVCPAAIFNPSTVGHVTAVAVNDTVTQTASSGYLTVYPTGSAVPGSSDLNWLQGQTVANFTLAGTGSSGEVSFYNGSVGSTQLIVDVFGFFANS